MTVPALADIAKFSPLVRTEMIDEAAKLCPEFSTLGWKSVPGYTYKSLVKTANPTVTFRDVNTGATSTKGTYDNRDISLKVLNGRWECDKAIADACTDGSDVYMAREALATMQGSILTACKQLWYGTTNDANGFAGLASQTDASMLVNAGGSTAKTSVFVVAADAVDYLTWVLGGDGMFAISDPMIESVDDGTGKKYRAYVQDLTAWVGVQLGHAKAVCRICNVGTDSTKGLTDDLVYDAIEKMMDAGLRPSAIFCNARSLGQLRKARTTYSPTGVPAPFPAEVGGVPVFMTNALSNAEAGVSFSS